MIALPCPLSGIGEPGQFSGDPVVAQRGRLYQCGDYGQAAAAARPQSSPGPGELRRNLECPEDAQAKRRQHEAVTGRDQ